MASGYERRFKGKVAVPYGGLQQLGVRSALVFLNAGAPTNGGAGTLANIAPKGALLIDETNGSLYQNTNTLASPTWSPVDVSGAIQAGTGTGSYLPRGTISFNGTPVANTGTTALQTLMSYALPANSLSGNGKGIFVKTWGKVAGNAQTKSIQLTVGGQSLASASDTQSGVNWEMEAWYFRSGSGAQTALFKGSIGTTTITSKQVTDTASDTAAITIAQQATSGSGSGTDITENAMLVEFFG